MNKPLVSILIPCFNAEDYISEAISSALDQTYGNIEVIVLDDGSTDSSIEVIRRFLDYGNFTYESRENRGGNATRNELLRMSKGEYIQWLDADDILSLDKISRQIGKFESGYDMVFCDYSVITREGTEGEIAKEMPLLGVDLLAYFIRESVITMLPLHKKADLLSVGGFKEELRCCQEYELHLRLAQTQWKKIKIINEVLCRKRILENSVSANEACTYSTMAKLAFQLYSEIIKRYQVSEEQRSSLGTVLYTSGRHLVRLGLINEGRSAFQLAMKIAPDIELPYTKSMKILARLFGPVMAERLRSHISR